MAPRGAGNHVFATLTCELPGERLDRGASALREAFELARLKESVGVNCRELDNHTAAARVVECARELVVPGSQEAEHIQVPVVVTPCTIPQYGLDFVEGALAETLERVTLQLAKHLPV